MKDLDFAQSFFTSACICVGLYYFCSHQGWNDVFASFQRPGQTQRVEMSVATDPAPTEKAKPKKKQKKEPEQQKIQPATQPEVIMSAAPADPLKLPPAGVRDYIDKWYPTAVAEMHRTGVPASISLAQGIIESHAGRSIMAVSCYNHFGMKCHEQHKNETNHCWNFTDDSDKDFFLRFQNPAKSWKAHSDLLCRGRYKPLHKYGQDFSAWADGLQRVGYATSKTYAKALKGIIHQYKLYEYDNQ
jgi:flagellum-specific peptidoglycan hydrolase FlgJ